MIEKIMKTIDKHRLIESGDRVIVGISGGPDSVCLLHILQTLANRLDISIAAVHINHMLRGDESLEDELYVGELCKQLDIPLHVARHDIKAISLKKKLSVEETGREIRYQEYELLAAREGASKIAVAHNRNDQAETVLLNIIRGTGLEGLKGMDYKNGRIIRPLLDIDRKEIEDYCISKMLSPRIDSSNLENIYARNKVRLDLIPYINDLFNMDIVKNINRMSLILSEDQNYLEKKAQDFYNGCVLKREDKMVLLNLKKLAKCHPSIFKRVARLAVREVKGSLKGIESVHIESIKNLGSFGRTGSQVHLPDNVRAAKSYNILKIYIEDKEKKAPFFDVPVKIPGITRIDALNSHVESFVEKAPLNIEHFDNLGYNSLVQFFDYEKLREGVCIRNRKNGDLFKPYKSKGTKKLKEYFIDNKIARDIRDSIPVVAKDREIVWVIGYNIGDKFKVTENTNSVLKMVYRCN